MDGTVLKPSSPLAFMRVVAIVLAAAGASGCADSDTIMLGASLQLTGNLAGTGR